jgi:hypothetical protein
LKGGALQRLPLLLPAPALCGVPAGALAHACSLLLWPCCGLEVFSGPPCGCHTPGAPDSRPARGIIVRQGWIQAPLQSPKPPTAADPWLQAAWVGSSCCSIWHSTGGHAGPQAHQPHPLSTISLCMCTTQCELDAHCVVHIQSEIVLKGCGWSAWRPQHHMPLQWLSDTNDVFLWGAARYLGAPLALPPSASCPGWCP